MISINKDMQYTRRLNLLPIGAHLRSASSLHLQPPGRSRRCGLSISIGRRNLKGALGGQNWSSRGQGAPLKGILDAASRRQSSPVEEALLGVMDDEEEEEEEEEEDVEWEDDTSVESRWSIGEEDDESDAEEVEVSDEGEEEGDVDDGSHLDERSPLPMADRVAELRERFQAALKRGEQPAVVPRDIARLYDYPVDKFQVGRVTCCPTNERQVATDRPILPLSASFCFFLLLSDPFLPLSAPSRGCLWRRFVAGGQWWLAPRPAAAKL